MTTFTMKPIRYNARQVALMLEMARHLSKNGRALNFKSLGLERDGEGFVWIPR
jgi:hypothetical protein